MNKARLSKVLAKLMIVVAFVCAAENASAVEVTETDAIAASKKFDLGCNDFDGQEAERFVEKIVHTFKYSYDTEKDSTRSVTFYSVSCSAGAYNYNSVLLRVDPYENTLSAVALATPRVNAKGEVTGWMADVTAAGLSYDEQTQTLTSFAKGRGVGDMYVLGTYRFFEGEVVLVKYFIDGTEGEDEAPGTVYESKLPLNY